MKFTVVMIPLVLITITGSTTMSNPIKSDGYYFLSSEGLDNLWEIEVDSNNQILWKGGELEISAFANSYAHIRRALDMDTVCVGAKIKSGGEEDAWATSISVYWDKKNWCQFYPVKNEKGSVGVWYGLKGGGLYKAIEMINGKLNEHLIVPTYNPRWHRLAIELGEDCIRYRSSSDGNLWVTLETIERPLSWKGKAPKYFIVGKGSGLKNGAVENAESHLNNSSEELGNKTTSYVDDIFIIKTPQERIKMTELEQTQLKNPGIDWLGKMEMDASGDPQFDSVSRHFPELNFPREVIGIKEHPQDIGVIFDGSLQLKNFHTGDHFDTNSANPVGFYEIGTPPTHIGREVGSCKKRLLNGYLPVVICDYQKDGLVFEQTVFGYSEDLKLDNEMFAYSRMTVSNPGTVTKKLELSFKLNPSGISKNWQLEIMPQTSASVFIKIPWSAESSKLEKISKNKYDKCLLSVTNYWNEIFANGMQINTPEARVNNAYRAWLAYNFINVDKKENGYLIPDGAGFYDELYGYSACHNIRSLDLYGYHKEARAYLEANLSLVREDGLFFTNFGLPDTAAILVAMADHYRITNDENWLKTVAPKMKKMCDWIIDKREEDRENAPDLVKGMIYFRPYADYPEPTYNYFTDSYLCVALSTTADVLKMIGMTTDADRIAAQAKAYRSDIINSMNKAIVEHEGLDFLPMMPTSKELLKMSDYHANDYYGLLCSMLLELDFLEPNGKLANTLVDCIEKRGGLSLGSLAWRGGIDHAYIYGYNYNCLQRNKIENTILSLYGWMAYGMSRNTFSGVEINNHKTGDNQATLPHSFSGTEQLRLLRMMLVRSEGATLILGQAIPKDWLSQGKEVEIKNAATVFGNLNYSIISDIDSQNMTITLNPPLRTPPELIILYVRHPEDASIKNVNVNDMVHKEFTKDTIHLYNLAESLTIKVDF